ncbi:MAG: GNAT family N-acetyltransferase [Chitinophagaceae bacterium]
MIDFNEDYILENNIVCLSPLRLEDIEKLNHFSINEPDLWTYSLLQANTPEKMEMYIKNAIEGRKNEHSYPFLVFDKRSNEVAGSTRFYDIQIEHATLQLGYTWYGKKFQNTGLNKNCKYLLLAFAFETLGIERVEFRADNENNRSINAMKSIGCKVEGILRSNTYKANGERRDSIILSILKHEWFNSVKESLKNKCSINY